jgi:hypothetical protein
LPAAGALPTKRLREARAKMQRAELATSFSLKPAVPKDPGADFMSSHRDLS